MSTMNRRQVLRSLLTDALQAASTVVLACSVLPTVLAQGSQEPPAEDDLQERADRLASEEDAVPENDTFVVFRRGGFANGGGGFRRGGYGGGGFRRGGFANGGGGGGFRRGAGFRNW
jgi:hypothetical protein